MSSIADFRHLISQKQLILEPKDPFVVTVKDASEGFSLAKDILYEISDKKTLLFLSGGKTPKQFYETLAKEEKLQIGVAGLVDERYGEKFHDQSNELMIKQTGLLGYLHFQKAPFYPILSDKSMGETASNYDETLRFLLNGFGKSIGILGVGLDGHTAGIAGNRKDFKNPMFEKEQKDLFVSYFDDEAGMFKKRVSMTFLGLSRLDIMLVLVFGEEKKEALQEMFANGPEEEIPARFFKRPDIAQKTLLITDQKV